MTRASRAKMGEVTGVVYNSLRRFVREMELRTRIEIRDKTKKAQKERLPPPSALEFVCFEDVMVRVQARRGNANAQWVLRDSECAWYTYVRLFFCFGLGVPVADIPCSG